MKILALDLSINASGIALADTDKRCIYVTMITPEHYDKCKFKSKYQTLIHNTNGIANTLAYKLRPYGYLDTIIVETLAYGLHASTDLLILQGNLLGKLTVLYKQSFIPVMPKVHKKRFTGNDRASKQQSVAVMLKFWPLLPWHFDKLDDLADAIALLSCNIPDITEYDIDLL
jgi:Holliday junction resolvasome RuvABC endonuclease subunit